MRIDLRVPSIAKSLKICGILTSFPSGTDIGTTSIANQRRKATLLAESKPFVPAGVTTRKMKA